MTHLQFQVFVAVVEARSFTKAAHALGFTQSAVSQIIGSLESELGITLLHRSRSGVTPTKIGERMLQHIRKILHVTDCMKQEASAFLGIEAGTLRIGSIPSISAKLLPGLITSFKKLFPAFELVLFEGSKDEVTKWVSDSVVDLGFVSLPTPELQTIPLMEDEMILFLPADHRLKDAPYVTFAQMKGHCFIMPKADCIRQVLEANGLDPVSKYEVNETSTILTMVQEGIGYTILPQLALPENLPNVQPIPLQPKVTRQIALAVRTFQCISPAAAEFLVHAQEYVQKLKATRE